MGWIDRLQRYGFFPVRPHTNGNGKGAAVAEPAEAKSLTLSPPVSFIPRDSDGRTVEHPLFGATGREAEATRSTAYAVAAYCYVACRYRAEAVSEAPLMVVRETEDGEDWIKGHPADEILDEPSPDYDMGELLYLTRIYRDLTGIGVWTKDRDLGNRSRRLTPFSGDEVELRTKDGRIYGEFVVQTQTGDKPFSPNDVVFFREIHPGDWWAGLGWVEVALSTLNLSRTVARTVRSLLRNALMPSVIIQTHQDWNPDDTQWERFKAELKEHAEVARKGDPLAITGGGSATRVTFGLKDLVPDEIMDRVEATVAACSGIPAVVLQFLVGLKNSPWSQMEEARRMCYEDTIDRLWKRDEKVLTRQLLREYDDDPTHYIRFDRSRVVALKADDTKRAAVVRSLSDIWTVDEGRAYTGQQPRNDELGETIISHARPQRVVAAPQQQQGAQQEPSKLHAGPVLVKAAPVSDTDRDRARAVFDALTDAQEHTWRAAVTAQLERDRATILDRIDRVLASSQKSIDDEIRRALMRRMIAEIEAYAALARGDWRAVVDPLIRATASTGARNLSASMGLDWDLMIPGVDRYAEAHGATMVTRITDTTREELARSLRTGLRRGESMDRLRRRIEQSEAAFGEARSELIARTETTGVTNGARFAGIREYAEETGDAFTKEWLPTDDRRTRLTHEDLRGEVRPLNEPHSNGLMYPGDPDGEAAEVCNCRCTHLYAMAE